MCTLCGGVEQARHWTDRLEGTASSEAEEPAAWRQGRQLQIALANRILSQHGLAVRDWDAHTFVLSNRTGQSELVSRLAAGWSTAERLRRCPCDPLKPVLPSPLEGGGGVEEAPPGFRVPPFDRLVLETTGLADPAPILFTLTADPVLRHHFRLGSVVTTIDAVNGAQHLVQHLESIKQVAVADRMVLTKTDLVDRARVEGLRAEVARYNPTAPFFETPDASLALDRLFSAETFDPADCDSPSVRRARAPLSGTVGGGEDRKSTRLNSSHGYISYAVFCLKKKK